MHKDNNLRHKHSPPKLYDVHGSKLKTRLTIAARSFPRCKPWHNKMRGGFYDTEFELEPEVSSFESVRTMMSAYSCIARRGAVAAVADAIFLGFEGQSKAYASPIGPQHHFRPATGCRRNIAPDLIGFG